jgi:hypothetical protein
MVQPEEASASESDSEINTRVKHNHHPGINRPSLAKTGFAARLVLLKHPKPRTAS